jgi:hypothetical protein
MMFYWLDSFAQCLPLFFYQDVGSNLTSCIVKVEALGGREKKQDDERGGGNRDEDHHYRAEV